VLKVSPTHSGHDTVESYIQPSENLNFCINNSLPRSNNILWRLPTPLVCGQAQDGDSALYSSTVVTVLSPCI
jgi:hypothetical protein